MRGSRFPPAPARRGPSGDLPLSEDPEFRRDFTPDYGAVVAVSPLIRRVVARNPGPFTFMGTGTYIVGRGRVAVIDPGPADRAHVAALVAGLGDEVVSHILVTHTHRDHSPATPLLQAARPALSHGFGPHGGAESGRGDGPVEEGADHDFAPDRPMGEGDVVAGPGWTLEAVHTPGHTSNHLCFRLREENALFSGDHVMGWSTTVVSPPDGDMGAYMASLEKVRGLGCARFWPTHGSPIEEPGRFVRALIGHRRQRERQILDCLADGTADIPAMVVRLYRAIDPRLHKAAGRSVLAHLVDLERRGVVAADGTTWRMAGPSG